MSWAVAMALFFGVIMLAWEINERVDPPHPDQDLFDRWEDEDDRLT